MADGKKVPTPENGYNEVLPRFCANSKAHNQMREMVVTHTGLEREAIINCKYEIETKAGVLPFLMGNEVLTTTCPIQDLKIVVKVPAGTELKYKLLNSEVKPKVKKGNSSEIYIWNFKNLSQYMHEKHEPEFNIQLPRLVFSTQKNRDEMLNWFKGQNAFDKSITNLPEPVKKAVSLKETAIEKVLEVQRIVVEEMNLISVPLELTAFQISDAQQCWASNSGTPIEKSVVMASLLQSMGIDAEVCFNFPTMFKVDGLPFLLESTPFVQVSLENQNPIRLSPVHLNSNSSEFEKSGYSILTLNTNSIEDIQASTKGEISILGSLDLETNGKVLVTMQGKFMNSCNPYFKLERDKSVSGLMTGIKGDIYTSTPEQTEVHFKGQTDKLVKIKGDYYFMTIPKSSVGLKTNALLPLPTERSSVVSLDTPLVETYNIELNVPDGLKLINEELVEESSTVIGSISVKIKQTGNKVNVYKKIELNHKQIPLTQYGVIKKLTNTWNLQKYNELVFRKTEL